MSRISCPSCGHDNRADIYACSACGATLNPSGATEQSYASPGLPENWWRIMRRRHFVLLGMVVVQSIVNFVLLGVVAVLSVLLIVWLSFGTDQDPQPVGVQPLPTASHAPVPSAAPPTDAFPEDPRLFMNVGGSINMYDGTSGTLLAVVASASRTMNGLTDIVIGPDQHLYVSDGDVIRRYNGHTGVYLDTFVDLKQAGFHEGTILAFGPDGNLYVAGPFNDHTDVFPPYAVLRFDGSTGRSIDAFIPPIPGTHQTIRGMTFGPDGKLYVLYAFVMGAQPRVVRFDGTTGAFGETFIDENQNAPSEVGGWGFTFGPDQNLYIMGSVEGVYGIQKYVTVQGVRMALQSHP